jgi:hypothetical protein
VTDEIDRLNKSFAAMSKTSTIIAHSGWNEENLFTDKNCKIRIFSGEGDQRTYLVEVPAGIDDFDFIVMPTKREQGQTFTILKPQSLKTTH